MAVVVPGPSADLEALVAADARAWERIARRSKELALVVCGSGFGDASPDKPRNRWRLFAHGIERAHYDKVHLFSPTAEPESFSAGLEPPPVVDLGGVRVGGLVCYDLRFPELTRRAFHLGADLICVSAQWPSTRATQWRALCLGLAVSNQCFVVACNRTGVDVIGRRELTLEFPGNSLIVDPYGEVLAEGRGEVGCLTADIDFERARELRRRVPVERDARPDVYAAWPAPKER